MTTAVDPRVASCPQCGTRASGLAVRNDAGELTGWRFRCPNAGACQHVWNEAAAPEVPAYVAVMESILGGSPDAAALPTADEPGGQEAVRGLGPGHEGHTWRAGRNGTVQCLTCRAKMGQAALQAQREATRQLMIASADRVAGGYLTESPRLSNTADQPPDVTQEAAPVAPPCGIAGHRARPLKGGRVACYNCIGSANRRKGTQPTTAAPVAPGTPAPVVSSTMAVDLGAGMLTVALAADVLNLSEQAWAFLGALRDLVRYYRAGRSAYVWSEREA